MSTTASRGVRDRAGELLQSLSDPDRYVKVPDVIEFDQHSEVRNKQVRGPDGQPVMQTVREDIGPAELQQHAANCNAAVASGSPPSLGIGHSSDDKDEFTQPINVGFAVNWRVVYNETLKRYVLVADEMFDKESYKRYDVPSFRFRSIERFPAQKTIPMVALIRRTPARPLGAVQYKGGAEVVRYSCAAFAEHERYSLFEGQPTIPERNQPMKVSTFQTRRDGIAIPEPLRMSRDLCEAALKYAAANPGTSFADAANAVRRGEATPTRYGDGSPVTRYSTFVDLGFRQERAERYASMTGPQGSYGQMPAAPETEEQPTLEMPQRIEGEKPAAYSRRMKAYAMQMERQRGIPSSVCYAAAGLMQDGMAASPEDALQRVLAKHENQEKYRKVNAYTR